MRYKIIIPLPGRTLWLLAGMAVLLAGRPIVFGQTPGALKERPVSPKPTQTTIVPDQVQTGIVVLKFREGTQIRQRAGQWAADLGNLSADDRRRLQRAHLDPEQVLRELVAVNDRVQNNAQLHVQRLFTRPEEELDQEKLEGERHSNEELADLNLYYHIFMDNAAVEDTEALIDQLNALSIVEIAYPQPRYYLAQADIPPTTPDHFGQGRQGYLDAAAVTTTGSNGIDARYAWTLNGGRGNGVRTIDIEYDWRQDHEDLPGVFHNSGTRSGAQGDINHGTAVLGVIRAGENGYGVTGIAPQSGIGFASAFRQQCTPAPCRRVYDVADAVNRASAALAAGDIILIEQQVGGGPTTGVTCPTSCYSDCGMARSQFGLLPVEWNQAEYDAIRAATLGPNLRIVVEAAGNGSMDLDATRYNQRFDRASRDSNAIMVGAGGSTTRGAWCWSNAGSRVDVQGWGDSIWTLGYGDQPASGTDQRQWYTATFGGTSGASPIVVGAAAAVQGVRRARGLALLSSIQMRSLLSGTGVAQAAGRTIGPLPNLREAIALYVDRNYLGVSLGTLAQPYQTLPAALGAAWDSAQIKMTSGTYSTSGPRTISQRVTLMSRDGTVTIAP